MNEHLRVERNFPLELATTQCKKANYILINEKESSLKYLFHINLFHSTMNKSLQIFNAELLRKKFAIEPFAIYIEVKMIMGNSITFYNRERNVGEWERDHCLNVVALSIVTIYQKQTSENILFYVNLDHETSCNHNRRRRYTFDHYPKTIQCHMNT
ncbi:hypothetical protein BLOT_008818 [Blomia tropicalis]|nr:hypothetical protein BLOT_008818 [Blomia tropicalis]